MGDPQGPLERRPADATNSLEKVGSISTKTLNFLNSAFGMFMLSTVIVGGLAKLYSDHQQALRESQAKREELTRLIIEFDYRLADAEHYADVLEKIEEGRKGSASERIKTIVYGYEDYTPALPEFKGWLWYGILSKIAADGVSGDFKTAYSALLDLQTPGLTFDASGYQTYDVSRLRRDLKQLRDFDDKTLVPILKSK